MKTAAAQFQRRTSNASRLTLHPPTNLQELLFHTSKTYQINDKPLLTQRRSRSWRVENRLGPNPPLARLDARGGPTRAPPERGRAATRSRNPGRSIACPRVGAHGHPCPGAPFATSMSQTPVQSIAGQRALGGGWKPSWHLQIFCQQSVQATKGDGGAKLRRCQTATRPSLRSDAGTGSGERAVSACRSLPKPEEDGPGADAPAIFIHFWGLERCSTAL